MARTDPNAAAKSMTEAQLLALLVTLLAEQGTIIRKLLADQGYVAMPVWQRLKHTLTVQLRPILGAAGTTAALQLLPKILGQLPLAERKVKAKIGKWSWIYAAELASMLFGVIQRAMESWLETGRTPIGSTNLDFYFGKARAAEIAATQTTTAFTAGERAIITLANGYGIQTEATWHTKRDSLVCELCKPREGKVEGEWGILPSFPPLHEVCRCWVSYQGFGDVFRRWQQ